MNPIKNLNWAVTLGHVIECFDSTLYGFFAVMLAPIFFPSTSHAAGLLASYGVFAAGFFARPLGAIIFGSIGDKYGRKKTLLWSIILVSIPTIGIGLTPSYESLGLAAPIFLITFRLFQGLLWGGEVTGVNLYNTESRYTDNLGARSGFLVSAGVLGAILASVVGAFVSMKIMPTWAWRIPFVAGGISAIFVFFLRKNIDETDDFLQAKKQQSLVVSPWKELLIGYKASIFVAILIAGLDLMPLYFASIFGNRLFSEAGYTDSQCMLFNVLAMITCASLVMCTGKLVDRIGFERQVLWGSLLIGIVSFPSFLLIGSPHISTLQIIFFIVFLVSAGTIINSCYMPYISTFFPTNCRYSGVAISVTLGQTLFGGTAPLVGSFLTDITGSKIAPAFWIAAVAFITAFSVFNNSKKNTSLSLS
jgi:MHS family proline/betaine transporter-like MFS transporter